MGEVRESVVSVVKEPWFYSVLLLSITPLFPDYICFILVFAAFVLSQLDAKKQGRRMLLGKIGIAMAAFLGFMAVSIVYSTDRKSSFWTFVMWLCMFLAYLSCTTVLFHRRRLRAAILCMTSVTGVVGAVTVVQYFLRETFQLNVSDELWYGLDRWAYGLLGLPVSELDFGDRVSGTFNNPNLLAAYLVLTIPFSVAFIMTGNRSKPKAVSRIAAVLAVYALGFSFCRGGYLAMIALIGMFLLLFIRKHFSMTVLALICVVVLIPPSIGRRLVSVVPQSMDQPADEVQLEQLPDEEAPVGQPSAPAEKPQYQHDDSVNMRFVMWGKVLESAKERPLFGAGCGIGTTQLTLQAEGLDFKHAHNLFFELLAEGGVIFLLLFLGVVWMLCDRGVRLLRRREDSEAWLLGFAIIGACVALCVSGVFDFPLLTPRIIVTCMLLMGVAESAVGVYLQPAENVSLKRN